MVTPGGGGDDKFGLDDPFELADGIDKFADLSAGAGDGYHYGRTAVFQSEAGHAEDFGGGMVQSFGEFSFDAGSVQVAENAYGADNDPGNGTELAGKLLAYHIADEFGTVAVTGLRQKLFQLFKKLFLNGKTHSDKRTLFHCAILVIFTAPKMYFLI